MVNPSDPQAAALLAHIVSQITSNVDFLVSQNYMSQSDASIIVSKLTTGAVVNQPASRAQVMPVGAPQAPHRRGMLAPPARKVQARALWAYNKDGQVCTPPLSTSTLVNRGSLGTK
jgi:hypothetical protein